MESIFTMLREAAASTDFPPDWYYLNMPYAAPVLAVLMLAILYFYDVFGTMWRNIRGSWLCRDFLGLAGVVLSILLGAVTYVVLLLLLTLHWVLGLVYATWQLYKSIREWRNDRARRKRRPELEAYLNRTSQGPYSPDII